MKRCVSVVSAVLMFCSAVAQLCHSQATSSAISGVVRDSSQAVIAGASIAVSNLETGISRTQETDAQGRYRVGELQPGTYEVRVTKEGFDRTSRPGVVLMVGQELAVNFALEVGGVEQEITIASEAPIIETSTASVASNVTQEQLRELPLNGRSFTDLITLQPGTNTPSNGVVAGAARANFGNGPQLSVSGARTDANNFMIDGTDMNNTPNHTPGSAAGVQLGVDTIREYQVITSNAKAEYGRNAGGIINAVSRSGTNQWHGAAFEFLRNSALDARNFFDGKDVPSFKRNQFGGTFGGAIKKDQTFFFLGYEGLQQRLGQTLVWSVPTTAARQGIGLLQPGQVVDQRVVPYLNEYPLPNGQSLGGGIAEYIQSMSEPTEENYGSARVDHNFSGKDFLFGRYTIDRSHTNQHQQLLSNFDNRSANQYATIQEDHIFGASLLNMFRAGYNRSYSNYNPEDVPNALALSFGLGRPMGQLSVGGLSILGPNSTAYVFQAQNIFQYEDNISYTRGPHTLKFGASVERFQWNTDLPAFLQGVYNFNNLTNFLLAGPTGTGVNTWQPGSVGYRHIRTWLPAFFAQDDYRVRPGLMLNLGLRWEFTTGLKENNDLVSYLNKDPFTSTYNDIKAGALWQNHIRNFDVRFGFNWSVDKDAKTALSGGFGIFHNQILHNAMVSYRYQLPFVGFGTIANVNTQSTFPNVYNAITAFAQGQGPVVFQAPVQSLQTREFDYYNFKAPTFYRFNISIQRELPGSMNARIGYIGSTGFHMEREQNLNRYPRPVTQSDGSLFFPSAPVPQSLNPALGNILFMASDANSNYNALVASLQKRFSNGLTFQTNYTYSKSIDDFSNSESNYVGEGRAGQFGPDRHLDRGRSAFNVPHAFVLNALYELPVGTGKRWLSTGRLASGILGGWQVGGILTLQQGIPFTVGCGGCTFPGYQFTASRPNLKPGIDVGSITKTPTNVKGSGPDARYFDPAAFSVPPAGTIGNAGRTLLLGPPIKTLNFSLSKFFMMTERTRLQFRSEFFNVLNHTNYNNPIPTVFTSSAGTINPTAGRITSTSTTSRQIQFGLKLTF